VKKVTYSVTSYFLAVTNPALHMTVWNQCVIQAPTCYLYNIFLYLLGQRYIL